MISFVGSLTRGLFFFNSGSRPSWVKAAGVHWEHSAHPEAGCSLLTRGPRHMGQGQLSHRPGASDTLAFQVLTSSHLLSCGWRTEFSHSPGFG